LKIVLFEPQIPQNTGNIVRTCAVTGSSLVLINPGYSLSDRWLKRAGLDYWEGVDLTLYETLEEYLAQETAPLAFFSSKATTLYTDIVYQPHHVLVFGAETHGLPDTIPLDKRVRIPMLPDRRCLNLATSVGIGLYEALRQQKKGF